jgi:hypothetical protein
MVIRHFPCVLHALEISRETVLQRILVLSFRVLELLSEDVLARVRGRVDAEFDGNPIHFSPFARFIEPIITATSPRSPSDFRDAVFAGLITKFETFMLSDDEDLQADLSLIITLLLSHGYVQDRTIVADWIGAALRVHPVPRHFVVIETLVDLFPIVPILEFIRNWDFTVAPVIGGQIAGLIHTLFHHWSAFHQYISFEFLIGLLTVPCLPALNEALDLFREVTTGPIDPVQGAEVVSAIFSGMPRLYFRRQIGVGLAIIANLIVGGVIEPLSIQAVFLQYFPGNNPDVDTFAQAMLVPTFPDFVVEAADRLWEIIPAFRHSR